jgi:hypothetical protein
MCSRLSAKEYPMPRYFFHVIDGRSIIDNEGSELASLREVRIEAIHLAGSILRDEGDKFWSSEEWHMNVTDASGLSVLKLRFSADDQGIAPEKDQDIRVPVESVLCKLGHSRALGAPSLHKGGVRQVRT